MYAYNGRSVGRVWASLAIVWWTACTCRCSAFIGAIWGPLGTSRSVGYIRRSASVSTSMVSSVGLGVETPASPPSTGRRTVPKNKWKQDDASLVHRSYKAERVPDDIDYIIIGSGIGGLWLSACLAKFGIRSLVLEQHYIAGGFQHTFVRKGYEFVPGLHYIANLELCAPLYDLVADPNHKIVYKKAGNCVPADEGSNCSHDLGIGDLPVMHVSQGKDSIRRELVKNFPDEAAAIDSFIAIMEKAKWQAGMFMTFKIFPRPIQWLMSQLVCSTYMKYASMTTEEALVDLTSDGRLQTVLSAFGGDLGESIRDGSFVMQAAVLGHVIEGCHYPEGGPLQFVRGLVPTIRSTGGDILVNARVDKVLVEGGRAAGVRLANGDVIRANKGVVSDAGMLSTLTKLIPEEWRGCLSSYTEAVKRNSGGISHVFAFVGLNATHEELGLRSSSFYYIPCNATKDMDASQVQDFYRDTLLDENVPQVSAGIVFASAKDPDYAKSTMPGKATAIIFSEAKDEDFLALLDMEEAETEADRQDQEVDRQGADRQEGLPRPRDLRTPAKKRSDRYEEKKALVEKKLVAALLSNFPHLEPHIEVVEIGTPLTLLDYTLRAETLGLRHTPSRMCEMDLTPHTPLPGFYFTGQDVAFAGWAGALTGAMVTAQRILGYTLVDFAMKKTLLRDLGGGDIEVLIQARSKEGTASSPLEVAAEVVMNAVRHIQRKLDS